MNSPVGAIDGILGPVEADDLPAVLSRDERDASAVRADGDSADEVVPRARPPVVDGPARPVATHGPCGAPAVEAESDGVGDADILGEGRHPVIAAGRRRAAGEKENGRENSGRMSRPATSQSRGGPPRNGVGTPLTSQVIPGHRRSSTLRSPSRRKNGRPGGMPDAPQVFGRCNCHETPYRSATQANFRLNG